MDFITEPAQVKRILVVRVGHYGILLANPPVVRVHDLFHLIGPFLSEVAQLGGVLREVVGLREAGVLRCR